MYSFGAPGIAPGINPKWIWRVKVAAWFLIGSVIGSLLVLARAHGGCRLPPDEPIAAREADLCDKLHRPPGCKYRVPSFVFGSIDSDESNYTVNGCGAFLGTFPIVGGMLINPADLTLEIVQRSILLRTGTEEFQANVRRACKCHRVAFLDRVLDWQLGHTDILIGCAQ